jgi:hypothetical protein
LYDQALVIVTADHGVSFRNGGYMSDVDDANVGDIAGVPLFVKYPGQRGRRTDTRDAKTTDVLPTIADVVGARVPWETEGRSLRSRPVARPIVVGSFRHETVTASPARVAAGVRATARRNARIFGEGAESLYDIGPHRELLGKPASAFPRSRFEGASVRFATPELFGIVRPTSILVPSRILGAIEGRAPSVGAPLAVAVSGRIAATSEAFRAYDQTQFAALVPERSFRAGRNEVDVYAVEKRGRGIRLAWLGGTSAHPNTGAVQTHSRAVTASARTARPQARS